MKIGYLMQAGVPDLRRLPLSGPANHVKQVFLGLRNLGHHVCLLALLDGRVWKSQDLERFEPVVVRRTEWGGLRLLERGVRRVQYELNLPYAALFESLRFASACRQELAGSDLLYERMGWFGYGGELAARWLRVPLILEVNGDHLNELELRGMLPNAAQRWLSVALMKRAVGGASTVVATGEGFQQAFIERWGVDAAKVTVVDNGSELVGLLDREQLRSFHPESVRDGVTTIVYAGGFDPWHGINTLIQAVAMGLAHGASLKLLLVGSGPGRQDAERQVSAHHIEAFVGFTGQLPAHQYAPLLAQADIGVSPYCGRREYVGMKLIDYKAAGLAIVASGERGQPRLIEHGRTGWIVPPCDPNALSDAIVRLASDVGLRTRMGRAARIEAEPLHGWNRVAERLDALFSRTVEGYRRPTIRSKRHDVLKVA